MRRKESDFTYFTWHKQYHYPAYAIAAAEQCSLSFRDCMEMLDTILAHAEEEFGKYSLLFITGAYTESGQEFAGSFIVVKQRIPTADEFDQGALLVLSGRSRDTALLGTFHVFIREETDIHFEH